MTARGQDAVAGPSRDQQLPVASGRVTAAAVGRAAMALPGLVASSTAAAVVGSIATIATPVLLGRVVDVVIAALDRRTDVQAALTPLLAAVAVAVVVGAVLTSLALREAERLGASIAADLRERVVDRSLRMAPQTLERAGVGDVSTRVTEDVEVFTRSVPTISAVINSLITVGVSVVAFVTLDWRIALAFFTVVPVYVLSLRSYLPKAAVLYAEERSRASTRSRVLLESVHGSRTVHAYGMGELQADRVRGASEAGLAAALRARRAFAAFAWTMNAAEAVGLSAVIATGFLLVRADLVSVGDVTAAALLFHRLFGPLGILLTSFDDVQRAAAALARIVGVAQMDPPTSRVRPPRLATATVRLTGIRHAYDDGHEVLHGIDLVVPAGTSLAVVGESGAGKTTLAAIAAGVFPPSAGTVELVDGEDPATAVDLADLDQIDLRSLVGMVSQESHVFAGTLREDLQLVRPGCGDEELWAALDGTGAAAWARALPDGLDTVVGAGGHPLTAAQEQHLALTRLYLRDPPVVVLDEATAEASSAGARELERVADDLLTGRTAVVVAHRLTQARACDRILVMADGRAVELGHHDELVAAGGMYARLWRTWTTSGRDATA
ncbi:ATP-binding cassette domain-containing protein [Auraticoccus sp. F435]|uniref:ATP-binding cassette domain-containing protein n=1 Tax=Auraticoccus cholistanensis TaxID=2656650 RepID=A0A6A9UQZ1_9ACTN|nr:ABC transporter ATP-binding protein [Auraticoccus cholistanensis]MVA74998.1 ATP-binding cassette domain-containing protein [Auraticoccus cholistanensis]